jgi:RNA polymerase sigma-70 factor (ECF subfamily)
MTASGSELAAVDDRALVERARARDAAALLALGERLGCVPRFLRCRNDRFGRPVPEQELADVTQEVIRTIWSKLDSFRGDATLETWAYRFCDLQLRNWARRHRRRALREHPDGASMLERIAIAPDEALEPSVRVLDLVELLPRADAQLVRMKYFDELTFEQIAAELGASVNTIKSRLYRALDRVRASLRRAERGEQIGGDR